MHKINKFIHILKMISINNKIQKPNLKFLKEWILLFNYNFVTQMEAYNDVNLNI